MLINTIPGIVRRFSVPAAGEHHTDPGLAITTARAHLEATAYLQASSAHPHVKSLLFTCLSC